MTAPLNMSMVMTLNAAGVRAGANDVIGDVDRMGEAARRSAAAIGNAAGAATTDMQRLIAATVGLRDSAAIDGSRAWTGALASEGMAIDALRAKYSPLYATIQQYKAAQAEIRTAHAMGALSADEMSAALARQRQAALSTIAAIKGLGTVQVQAQATAGARRNFGWQQLGLQGNDVATMMMMGAPAGQIAASQGPQIFQTMQMWEGGISGAMTDISSTVSSLVTKFPYLTAAAGGAGVAIAAMYAISRRDGPSTEELLNRHEAIVQRIKEAYGAAAANVGKMTAEEGKIVAFQAGESANDLKLRLAREVGREQAALKAQFITPDNMVLGPALPIEQQLRAFITSTDTSGRALADLRSQLTDIGANAADPGLRKLANTILDLTQDTDDLRRSTEGAARDLDDLKKKAAELQLSRIAGERLAGRGAAYEGLNDYYERQAAGATDSTASLDFMGAGRQQIAALKSEAAAIGMTGEQLTAFRYEQQRLNEARAQGISLSEEQLQALHTEAQSYAVLKDKVAAADFLKSGRDQVSSLQAEATALGLTGTAAAAYRYEQQRLQEARQQNIDLTVKEREALHDEALAYAELQSRMAAINLIKGQQSGLETTRAELALVGQSEATRKRVLALLQAEQQIRQQNINTASAEAQQIRRNAVEQANLSVELDRQKAAWSEIQKAGDDFVDTLVNGLAEGDLSLENFGKQLEKQLLQLAIGNPIKNALLGENNATMTDVIGRLFGGGAANDNGMQGLQSVGTMSVSAGTVTIMGAGLGGSGGGIVDTIKGWFGGASSASGAASAVNGSDARSQIWNFFASKGLKDFQIAGIMGNIGGESRFNPTAINPTNGASGLFQDIGSRLSGLRAAGGGQIPGLTGQLDYAWAELQGPERRTLQQLMASTNVRQATGAFAGFERAEGWSRSNPEGITGWNTRLSEAQKSLQDFSSGTQSATQNLGGLGTQLTTATDLLGKSGQSITTAGTQLATSTTNLASGTQGAFQQLLSGLGAGIDGFLSGLSSIFSGGGKSGGGLLSWLGSLFGGSSSDYGSLGVGTGGLYAEGGISDRPAIFGEAGMEAAVPLSRGRRIPVEMRAMPVQQVPVAAPAPTVIQSVTEIHNHTSAKVRTEEEQTPTGGRRQRIVIEEVVGAAISRKGSAASKALGTMGVQPKTVVR